MANHDYHSETDVVEAKTVLVKKIPLEQLPDDVRKTVAGFEDIYAIHNLKGECLALFPDHKLAHSVAKRNELNPMSVH